MPNLFAKCNPKRIESNKKSAPGDTIEYRVVQEIACHDFQLALSHAELQCVPAMPPVILGIGIDVDNNLVSVYIGSDFAACKNAVHSALQAGSIILGHVYKNPQAAVTLR
jgi:hypothetical protein